MTSKARLLVIALLAATGGASHDAMPVAAAPQTARRARQARRTTPPTPPADTTEKLTGRTAKAADPRDIKVEQIDAAALARLLPRGAQATANARPLLVNFWATWCEPCRAEFPDLVKIDAEFRPRGLEFFTVSLDDKAEIGTTVPEFLRETGAASIPAYLLDMPEPADAINLVDPAWSGALPATFLFDRAGKLVYKHTGRIDPAELRTAIKKVTSDR